MVDRKAPDRREQRRQEHQELSRGQILDAAEVVFADKGFSRTTLKEVAQKAGFAVGSVYLFFESKDDLFRQVFERRNDEWIPEMRNLVGDEDGPPRLQLHGLIDLLIGFSRRYPAFARLYLRYAAPSAAGSEPFADTSRMQVELFARGQRRKLFRSGDPESLSRLFTGLVTAFQAQDPRILEGDRSLPERLSVAELHDIVERAFMIG